MEPKSFFAHDTDEQIIHTKRLQDLNTWIAHLNYVSTECDMLVKIASSKLNDKDLKEELLAEVELNSALLNEFFNYKGSIERFKECNDLECDLFYINQHDDVYTKYVKHINDYRLVKDKVYLKILD
ncbi:hypothetical protein [Xanthomarina sp. F2636L]|uniref:hypothetical protein n=1 Tax=Xanthomarina sp. F2636L TaxID=2996018 RepID=UPI00225E681C|nr:hypothetical protein [Xanthomarina sp. F2636L]MCX7550399.1 hypothetical protein [Xanthomarina sp. F2636L]